MSWMGVHFSKMADQNIKQDTLKLIANQIHINYYYYRHDKMADQTQNLFFFFFCSGDR